MNNFIFEYENVLSVFDGMSCGQLALQRANIKVGNYYASEIDKYAMQVAKNNFPKTNFIGDVTQINYNKLPKADLLIGGSPCQGFSFAGKQLNFEDPRSKLFFEFVKARDKNPNADFILENVKMKKEYQDVITSYLGVEPVEINSSLVSAQNRKRLYWTNIGRIQQPADKGILLKDILDSDPILFKMASSKATERALYNHRSRAVKICSHKSPTLLANQGKSSTDAVCFILPNGSVRWPSRREAEILQTVPEGYTSSVSYTAAQTLLGNGWTIDVISHILLSNPLI